MYKVTNCDIFTYFMPFGVKGVSRTKKCYKWKSKSSACSVTNFMPYRRIGHLRRSGSLSLGVVK